MKGCVTERLHSLSLFVVFRTVSNDSRNSNIKTVVNVNLLSAMTTSLIWNVNDDFLNQFVHYFRSKFRDMFILLHYLDESSHISGLLLHSFDISRQLDNRSFETALLILISF